MSLSNKSYQKSYNDVELLEIVIDGKLAQVNTVLPCTVISAVGARVTVKPLIQRIFIDNNDDVQYAEYGEIPNIPVLSLGNSKVSIAFPPPSPGDTGVLLVNQNFVGDTYNSGELQNDRKYSLLDGVYLPFFDGTPAAEDELHIKADTFLLETEHFAVKNQSGTDLLATIIDALQVIVGATTTNPGIGSFNAAAQASINAEIAKLQGLQ